MKGFAIINTLPQRATQKPIPIVHGITISHLTFFIPLPLLPLIHAFLRSSYRTSPFVMKPCQLHPEVNKIDPVLPFSPDRVTFSKFVPDIVHLPGSGVAVGGTPLFADQHKTIWVPTGPLFFSKHLGHRNRIPWHSSIVWTV